MLARFFGRDVSAFLAALTATRGVLSGSFALAFIMAPISWVPKDLDVVLPNGKSYAVHNFQSTMAREYY